MTPTTTDHSPTITRSKEGHDLILTARGAVIGEAAQDLASQLADLDPEDSPVMTLDLREATALDPLVVNALLKARERRSGDQAEDQGPEGDVRILVCPGRVQKFLDSLRLEHAFEVVHEEAQQFGTMPIPLVEADTWSSVRMGSVEHWHELLAAARRHDLVAFLRLSGESHPICVAAGADPGGPAFGAWCAACPLHALYGGCRALLDQANHAVELGNWDAAQLLVLALIAEAVGMDLDRGAVKTPG